MLRKMEVNPLEICLNKPYLSKKLEHKALQKVLNSSFQTAYRLYLLVNDEQELQYFANLEEMSDKYFITAYVKTEYAFIGEARNQIWQIKHLQPLLKNKPKYTLRCSLTRASDNKELYRCTATNIKTSFIYNLVQQCIEELNTVLEYESVEERG